MSLLAIRPILTEKTTRLAGDNQFVFLVKGAPSKFVIKEQFKVLVPDAKITKMNVATIKPKTVRRGRRVGKTSTYKKVFITVQPDSVTAMESLLGAQ